MGTKVDLGDKKCIVIFTVEGDRFKNFPLDMLRHDRCWPLKPEDVAEIERDYSVDAPSGKRSVHLASNTVPTMGRWMMLGRRVVAQEARR